MARPIAEEFGRAFRAAYKSAGLTQVELAERLRARGWTKVDQSQISKWVRGVSMPSLEILPDVDAVCGQPRGYVLRVAGFVEDVHIDVRSAIMADPQLPEQMRLLLVDHYDGALRRATALATASKAAATPPVASQR